jgi:hypothetical protein
VLVGLTVFVSSKSGTRLRHDEGVRRVVSRMHANHELSDVTNSLLIVWSDASSPKSGERRGRTHVQKGSSDLSMGDG